jgi:hypothetical protein
MPTETIHFRVEYSNGAVYHIIASTNVDQMENWNTYFPNQNYEAQNGLASLFMKSEKARDLMRKDKNVFVQNGNAREAAGILIDRLNVLNKESKPLFEMEY